MTKKIKGKLLKAANQNGPGPIALVGPVGKPNNHNALTPRVLEVTLRAVGSLSIDPKNARTHDDKQLAQVAASIKRFGFINPILVDEHGMIIAGHARYAAAPNAGLDVVPVIVIEGLSEAERRALALADNKIALNAGWDENLLAIELEFLADLQIDLDVSLTGFDTVEIDAIIASAKQDNEPIEEPPLPPCGPAVSMLGDIWHLGPHRVICGNALLGTTYAEIMGTDQARMAFLDAPYNVPIDGHVSGLGKNHHREFAMGVGEMSPAAFTVFLKDALSWTATHCMDGAIIFSCIDWRHLQEMSAAGEAAHLDLKNLIVWAKNNGGMGTFYRSAHELIFAFKHGTAKHLNNFGLGEGGRYRTNVWNYPGANTFRRDRDVDLAGHPTPKPIALVADAIMDVSNRGDIVLDPFGGGGTTLFAAEKTKRIARLIELDPLYVDGIVRRWLALSDKQAVLASTGQTFAEVEAERLDGPRQLEAGI